MTFVIKKDSWHYKFLAWYHVTRDIFDSSFNESNESVVQWYTTKYAAPYEFCEYWRAVLLWPAIRITTNIFLLATIFFIVWNIMMTGGGALNLMGIIVGIVALSALFVGLLYLAVKAYGAVTSVVDTITKDDEGLLATAYKSYKNKFCPKIEYEVK